MNEKNKRRYAKAQATSTLAFLAFLSPCAGLLLEITLAAQVGSSGVMDAFRTTSILLIFGSQLFIMYVIPKVLIPLFTQYSEKGNGIDAWRLIFSIAFVQSCVLAVVVIFIWEKPGTLVDFLGPGLEESSRTEALGLIKYFSLAVAVMVWTGVMSAALKVYGIFWAPPLSQMMTNLLMIAAILAMGREWASEAIAIGAVFGALFGFFIHVFLLNKIRVKSGIKLLSCLRLGPSQGLIKAFRLAIPLIAMIFLSQWGTVVIYRELSKMPPGTIAEFGYAWKLLQIIGILPASLSTVIFPALSKTIYSDNHSDFANLAGRTIRLTLLLTIPLSAAVFVIREPLVSILFERGSMTGESALQISNLFGIALISVPAMALWSFLNNVSFSRQDMKAPLIFAGALALMITFLTPYAANIAGAVGVVSALNLSNWSAVLGLFVFQVWRYHLMTAIEFTRYIILMLVLGSVFYFTALALQAMLDIYAPWASGFSIIELIVVFPATMFIGYFLAATLKVREAKELIDYGRWKILQIIKFK